MKFKIPILDLMLLPKNSVPFEGLYSSNKCVFSVYMIRIFVKCTHVCAAQKADYLYQIINKTWYPFLNGIAKPRTDIKIKVAAFTVSEKSSNTQKLLTYLCDRTIGYLYL